MSRIHAMIGLAFASATTADVHAQRLLEVEGIELRGTARIVEYGAATCNVVEASEAPAAYERKKASHGQPLDIWQLDFSVYNGSGRPLDHLIANYRIAAEEPPCTNWNFRDYERYPGPIEWGSLAGFIQRSGSGNPTAPRETITDTRYIFVFHDHQPRFDTWQVDYDFGAGAVAAPAPAPAPTPIDIVSPVNRPDDAGSAQPAPVPLSAPAGVSLVPPTATCAGQPDGAACWMAFTNQPECHLWTDNLDSDATITWSGECSAGYGQGMGTLTWTLDGAPTVWEGHLDAGRRNGNWVIRFAGGGVEEGPLVDGERNGNWVIRFADGDVEEGPYVDGKKNGNWVRQAANGTVTEGPFVDGKLHGKVISRGGVSGRVMESYFVDGEMNRRVTRHPSGWVLDVPYLDGERHGEQVRRNADGTILERGAYVNGKRQGHWVLLIDSTAPDRGFEEGSYVDGERHGTWMESNLRYDTRSEGRYVNGQKQGEWVTRNADGTVDSRVPYVNGRVHGEWLSWSPWGGATLRSLTNGEFNGITVYCVSYNDFNVIVYENGTRVEEYDYGDSIDDPQLARTAADICARLLSMERRPSLSRLAQGRGETTWRENLVVSKTDIGPRLGGKSEGFWIISNPDGTRSEGFFVDGERHGVWLFFWVDGDVRREVGPHLNGERRGTWAAYDAAGTVVGTIRFERGRRVSGFEDVVVLESSDADSLVNRGPECPSLPDESSVSSAPCPGIVSEPTLRSG